MIRRAERLHKRRTPSIFPADDSPAVRPHRDPERLRHVAARLHRRGGARRSQGRRRAGRRAARERAELRTGGRVHEERAPRRACDLRRRPVGGAAGADARRGDERAGRQRLHRRTRARRGPGDGTGCRAGRRPPAAHRARAVDRRDRPPAPSRADRRWPASGVDPSRDGALWKTFEDAVLQVARTLALAIVSDGEGASKVVEIQVVGGASEAAAREVGRAVARSALVKTAIYGADPNWGRILAAAGAAGVPLAVDRLSLQASADGEWLTLPTGGATAHPDLSTARAIFQQKTIRLRVDLGLGRAEAGAWTCDLTPAS